MQCVRVFVIHQVIRGYGAVHKCRSLPVLNSITHYRCLMQFLRFRACLHSRPICPLVFCSSPLLPCLLSMLNRFFNILVKASTPSFQHHTTHHTPTKPHHTTTYTTLQNNHTATQPQQNTTPYTTTRHTSTQHHNTLQHYTTHHNTTQHNDAHPTSTQHKTSQHKHTATKPHHTPTQHHTLEHTSTQSHLKRYNTAHHTTT